MTCSKLLAFLLTAKRNASSSTGDKQRDVRANGPKLLPEFLPEPGGSLEITKSQIWTTSAHVIPGSGPRESCPFRKTRKFVLCLAILTKYSL